MSKYSFGYKLSFAVLWCLHVLGATALVIVALALCGVPMNFWIGAASVIPGYLICKALHLWYSYESNKNDTRMIKEMLELTDEDIENIDKQSQDAMCPFNDDGVCTFGDGLPECVKIQIGGDDHES